MMKPDPIRYDATPRRAPRSALEQVTQMAEARIDPANARPGDAALSDDGQKRYRLEIHKTGGTTYHRADGKVRGKKQRKLEKRLRRQHGKEQR